jgi:hypothetical protein
MNDGSKLVALGCLCLLSACATTRRPPEVTQPSFPRVTPERAAQLIPDKVPERLRWAQDVLAALEANGLPPAPQPVCAVLAVIEQESGFKADPPVAGLARIARKELEERAGKLGPLGPLALKTLLESRPKGSKQTFDERLERVRTERDMDRLFRDLLAYYEQEFPTAFATADLMGGLFSSRLEDMNPVTTAGSMQVAVRFAVELERAKGGERPTEDIREELYTRKGGVYYGTARLLGYEAGYSEPLYRFADYNAGFYASRNAALQEQLSQLTGHSLALDGDMLIYDKQGRPVDKDSRTMQAWLAFRRAYAPDVSERELRRDLEKEKALDFESTDTYRALRRAYERQTGQSPAYARLPDVELNSPKMSQSRSTAWFARSVDKRYQRCLARWQELEKAQEGGGSGPR